MRTISVIQLKSNIKKYLDGVSKSSNAIVISGASEEKDVVILSMKEYNALTETGYLLSASRNRQRLRESINQLKGGRTCEFILKSKSAPRKGWEKSFKQMRENGDDKLLIDDVFDDEAFEERK